MTKQIRKELLIDILDDAHRITEQAMKEGIFEAQPDDYLAMERCFRQMFYILNNTDVE